MSDDCFCGEISGFAGICKFVDSVFGLPLW